MAAFDPHNYDVESQEIGSFEKLPQLWQEDETGNKSIATNLLSFPTEYHQVEQQPLEAFHHLDALFHDTTPPFRSCRQQLLELANIESQYSEPIKPHTNHKRKKITSHEAVRYEASKRKISTDEVIRLGGERFIRSCSSSVRKVSMPSHPYGTSFSGFSDQEAKDIELIQNLLLSAEKVSQKQFERSSKLLDWCDMLCSSSGNPIERLVHYFSKALREKIANETGRISFDCPGKKHVDDIAGRIMTPNPTAVSIYQKLPFFQAGQFSGVQALVDAVRGATKVHIIDLSIKQGVQCTILMQALTSQPICTIKHLKITALGTSHKQKIVQTGDWLRSFAESINLSFSFNVVMVEDMLDFNEDLLDLDPKEALAIYSSYGLWNMIGQQDRLESLMKVIKSIKPRVMVVSEAAVNLNSPKFVNRFIEALFYFGALFDALEDCMYREDEDRAITESVFMGNGIWSIVATEGAERVVRNVHINVWRKFFARFGMKEIELSMSSLYQANLVAEKFSSGSSCTFDMDGKCLTIGWKGSPIQSLSAWKFSYSVLGALKC